MALLIGALGAQSASLAASPFAGSPEQDTSALKRHLCPTFRANRYKILCVSHA